MINAYPSLSSVVQVSQCSLIFFLIFLVLSNPTPYFSYFVSGEDLTSSNRDPFVLHTEAEFCAPYREYAPDEPSKSIMRFLHKGDPSYWVSLPLPDHLDFAAKSVAAGGFLDSGYEVFQSYVKETAEDAITLDIGGHWGFAGLPIAATGRRVISFEPVPRNQRQLQLGVCFNGFFDRYTLVLGAVGEFDGNVTFHVPTSHWTDNAGLTKETSASLGMESEPINVRIFSLDTFVKNHLSAAEIQRVSFIKIDVQGHEVDVFRGGKDFFSRLKSGTWVMSEHMVNLIRQCGFEDHEDVEAILPLGYSIHGEQFGPEISKDLWDKVVDLWFCKL